MRNTTRSTLFFSLILLGFWGSVLSPPVAHAADSNPALKYHKILEKRPDPGYLFDRFYNAWLDRSTTESLETFLQKRVEEKGTTAAHLLLAFFYAKQNNDIATIDAFQKALQSDPHSASAWYYKAKAEGRILNFETAIADLQQAQKQNPDAKLTVLIQRQLGTMLIRNHESEKAIAAWKTLLAANPDDEELCEDIIELHLEEGLHEPAIALSEKLIAKTKDPYQAVRRRLRLGDIYHQAGQRRKAIEIYVSTLEKAGHDSWVEREILAQIEQIFRREDDLSGLKEQYDALLKTYPKRIALQRRRCRLLVQLGENDKAIEGYRTILELTPGDRGNREEYVDMLSQLDKHEQAIKELESLCKRYPQDAELQVKLAKTLHRAKKSEKAIQAVEQYLKISDQTEYAYLRAGRLAEQFGDKAKAMPFYSKMAETFPDSFSAQNVYATFLYRCEKKEDAIAIWKKQAKDIDLGSTLSLARALGGLGENELALELLLAREKEFNAEPLFLGQLVKTALRLKKFEEAIPWATKRVELSTTTSDLENAISQAVAACKQSDKLDDVIAELKASENRSTPSTCLLAELLEQTFQSDEADRVLQKPAEANESLAINQQIRLYGVRRDWEKAAQTTTRLLELSGERKSLHVRRLVELYERSFQLDKALQWVEKWKQFSPGSTMPWMTQARLLQIQGEDEEAQNALRKAIQRFDEEKDLRAQLAQSYAGSGKNRDAERMYWQLYEKTEDIVGKLRWATELAEIAEQDGDVNALVDNFKQRCRNNRKSIVPLLALSEIYRTADNYEGRRQALLDAAKIKPDDLQLLLHLARVEETEGNWNEAIATLQRAAKLDKTDKTRRKISQLYLKYGDVDKGFAIIRELINEQATDPRDLEQMVNSLCNMNEWEQAATLLSERITEHPQDYRLHYLLAVIYEELDQTDEAISQFTLLLDNQEELPSSKKQKQGVRSMHSYSYMDILQSIMPKESTEWFELSHTRYMAYQYRQRNRNISYGVYSTSGSQQMFIDPPPSVKEVRAYALTHLLTLAELLDESQQESLLSELKSHGVYRPEILLKARLHNNQSNIANLTEVLADYPDDEPLLALSIIGGMHSQQGTDIAHQARAFKIFRKKLPQLAIMAGVQAAARDAEYASLCDDILETAATIRRPNPLMLMAVIQTLGGQPWQPNTMPCELTKEQREKLTKQLMAWYPRVTEDKNNPYGSHLFYYVAAMFAQGEDPKSYFDLFEDEVSKWRKKPNNTGHNMMGYFIGQSDERLCTPIAFPPEELTDFPPHVFTMLSSDQHNPITQILATQSPEAWSAENLEPYLKKIKDPTLRILLAKHYELDKMVDADLAAMLAQKTPCLDAYLLAAGKASMDEDFEKSIELLEKVRHLPIKKDLRQRVDAALVANVLTLKESSDKKLSEALLKTGRDAALRLRRQRLNQQQRDQLIVVLEDLGLKKEAKRLEKRVAASSHVSTSFAPFMTQSAPTSQDRLKKLLNAGKRDAAARLLVGEIKSLGRQMMAQPQNSSYYSHQIQNLKKRIQEHGLTEDVLELTKPGESKSTIRLQEYALVCEILKSKEAARKVYEKILTIRPKDDLARIKLILMIEKDDKDSIQNHIKKISDAGSNAVGQLLSNSLHDYDTDWDQRFQSLETAIETLKIFKDRPRADISWVSSLIYYVGQQQYSNATQTHLPSLYVRRSESNNRVQEKDKAAQKRRLQLHRELCLTMLDIPELGRSGFQHLIAAAEVQEEPLWQTASDKKAADEKTKSEPKSSPKDSPEDFARYAEKVLLAEATHRNQRNMSMHVHFSSDANQVRFRSPEEYLATRAWKQNDWEHLEKELLPKLKKGLGRELSKSISNWMELYRCPEEKFIEAAKQVASQKKRGPMPTSNLDQLGKIVSVWAERSLKIDLEPLILDLLKKEANSNNYSNPNLRNLRDYFEELIKRGKRKQVYQVFEKMGTIYLGPKEKRHEFVKKNYQQGMIQHGSPNARIHQYLNMVNQFSECDSLIFLVLSEVESFSDLIGRTNLQYRFNESAQKLRNKSPEQILAFFEMSPWLEDLESFRILPAGKSAKAWPLVQLFENANLDKEKMEQCKAYLAKKQKENPTFGQGLLLAATMQKEQQTAVRDHLCQHLEAIQKLPARRQNHFAMLAKAIIPSHLLRNHSDPQVNAMATWIDTQLGKQSQKTLDEILKAKSLQDLGMSQPSEWEVGEYLGQTLPNLICDDPLVAKKVFLKVDELTERAIKRRQMHRSTGNTQSRTGEILENMLQRQDDHTLSPELIPFLIEIANTPQGKRISYNNYLNYATDRIMRKLFEQSRKEGNKTLPAEKAFPRFCEKLGTALGDRSTTFVLPNLLTLIRERAHNDKQRQQVVDWAKTEMQNGKYPKLAADLHACVQLYQEKKKQRAHSKPNGKPPEMADCFKHFSKYIKDETQPIVLRMRLVKAMCNTFGARVPLETAHDITRLYVKAMEENIPIDQRIHRMYFDVMSPLLHEASAKEMFAQWRELFAKHYIKNTPLKIDQNRVVPPEFSLENNTKDTKSLNYLLSVYLLANDTDRINLLLRKHHVIATQSPIIVAQLLRHDRADLAAKLFGKHKNSISFNWPQDELGHYSKKLHDNVPKLLTELSEKEDQYAAQVLFAAMFDPPSKKEEQGETPPLPKRDERLAKLVPQIADIEFTSPDLQTKLLKTIFTSPETHNILAETLQKDYELIELPENLASDPRKMSQIESVLTHYTNIRAKQGDFEPFIKILKNLSQPRPNYDHVFQKMLIPILQKHGELLSKGKIKWTPEQCKAIAELLRDAMKPKKYGTNCQACNTLLLVSHLWSGQKNELLQWYQTLPEKVRKELAQSGIDSTIWDYERSVVEINGETLQRRLDFVRDALDICLKHQWFIWESGPARCYRMRNDDATVFQRLERTKLFTPKEAYEHMPGVVEKLDDAGLAKAALGIWIYGKKQYEKAATLYESAFAVAPKDEDLPQLHYWRWGHTRSLKELKQPEKAKEVYEKIDTQKFPDNQTKWEIRNFQHQLNAEIVKAKKPK